MTNFTSPSPSANHFKLAVLLVEDEDAVREMICDLLEMSGYQVLAASDGRAALDICRRHAGALDLVITDIMLPQMGGRELAHQLARVRPGIKTLFMSGYPDDLEHHHNVARVKAAYLAKPFTLEEFACAVRAALDGK